MDDDELAHAWESFATALADVPRQREIRIRLNEAYAENVERAARRNYEMARHSHNPYVRGIRPGIFGFGIMI